MALQYSPKIVQDSLVMCLDASQNKSYPTDLPVKNGLVMWMDAADDTTFSYSSGTTVSQWRDKSGLNNHMVPISAGPTRSSALNSRKVLAFTTAQTIGSITFDMETSANTVFVVSRYTSSSTNANTVLAAYYNTWLLGHWGSQVNKYYAEGWVYIITVLADTVWRMYMGDWSGSSTDLASFYSNGTELANGSAAATAGPKGLGINLQSANASTCEAAEIIVFNRVLSATERKQVHTYLGQKWGISNTDRSIVDLSNNNNHGLLGGVAGSQVVADMPLFDVYNKGALKLDGSTDYIAVENATSLNPTTVTVSIWVKRNGYQSQTANYLRRNYNDAYGILGDIAADNVRFRIHNGTNYPESPNATLSLNEWTNIVGTYDLANIKIYKNGVFVGQTAHTSAISYSSANTTLTIGRDDPVAGRYMNANYGSVLIYSRALSATEISQNYEAQKSKFANTIAQQGLVLNLDAGNIYSYAGAGTTFYDVSPTALSWTINNATYNSSDPKYFSYNGSDSWLQSSTSAAYDSQTITMECWCYPNSLSQNGFLFEKGQVNTQYSMFFENANFVFRTMGSVSNQSSTFSPSTYLTVSAWNHIVCTYNGSSKIMYVNGIQVASVAASGALPTGQTDQYIGRHSSGYFFNGRIAESRVYNIALSAAQVLQNYNATKGRFGL